MSRRAVYWLAAVAIADAVVFALTIRAHLRYHPGNGNPSVMSLGEALGWIIGVGLLGVLVSAITVHIRAARTRRRLAAMRRAAAESAAE